MKLKGEAVLEYLSVGITTEVQFLKYLLGKMDENFKVISNISEMSKETGISRVTIHRIVKSLEDSDIIERPTAYSIVLTIFKE